VLFDTSMHVCVNLLLVCRFVIMRENLHNICVFRTFVCFHVCVCVYACNAREVHGGYETNIQMYFAIQISLHPQKCVRSQCYALHA
jgi:hypothetical protein